MAKRVSLKLPSFNLTKQSTSGKVVHQFIPRGFNQTSRATQKEDDSSNSDVTVHHEVGFQDVQPENLSTLHEFFQKKAAEMLHAVIESEALPISQMCDVCIKSSCMLLHTMWSEIFFFHAVL